MSVYESGDGPLVYPVLLKDNTNVGYVQLVPIEEGFEVGYHIGSEYTKKELEGIGEYQGENRAIVKYVLFSK